MPLNLTPTPKREILLKGGVVLTCGLDFREHKIEYNAWRKLWREHASLLPEAWRDFDAFYLPLPARPRDFFSLLILDSTPPLTHSVLEWTK